MPTPARSSGTTSTSSITGISIIPFERLVVDTVVAPNAKEVTWINPRLKPGERRKVLTGIPGKTGIVYTLDRQTGEFLWARPTVTQNVVSKIDGATGEVTVNPDTLYKAQGDERLICPSLNGGKNWPAGAYSPLTNTMYMPLQNMCMTTVVDLRQAGRQWTALRHQHEGAAPRWHRQGRRGARDLGRDRVRRCGSTSSAPARSPLVATGGGLVFGGDAEGFFRAFDDKTRQGAVGSESRLVGERLSDHVRRRAASSTSP